MDNEQPKQMYIGTFLDLIQAELPEGYFAELSPDKCPGPDVRVYHSQPVAGMELYGPHLSLEHNPAKFAKHIGETLAKQIKSGVRGLRLVGSGRLNSPQSAIEQARWATPKNKPKEEQE